MNRLMQEATPLPLGPKPRTRSGGNESDHEAGNEVAFLQQHVQSVLLRMVKVSHWSLPDSHELRYCV